MLAAVALLLAMITPAGNWVGPNWMVLLVYAPLSGISQELFFRGALLPALLRALNNRLWFALAFQALLFAARHLRAFMAVAQPGAIVAMTIVFLVASVGRRWQVQRDGTLAWAMADHSLMLIAKSLFGLVSA